MLCGIIPARAGFTDAEIACLWVAWDHPRSRGVYPFVTTFVTTVLGSSPLARGLRGARRKNERLTRIIPARAGFTEPHPRPPCQMMDHPRSRGVYPPCLALASPLSGSSPLARGLPGRHAHADHRPGIIPARAGFTQQRRRRPALSWDHPRSRGVYFQATGSIASLSGSSPLARGLPAGSYGADPYWQDHPRSRGVYPPTESRRAPGSGSSPLARGLQAIPTEDDLRRRIIPARAGFTSRCSRTPTIKADHPRSRGVYFLRDPLPLLGSGSSPLARGLPCLRQCVSTSLLDHPRSRGVYTRMPAAAARVSGSSPLARGLQNGYELFPGEFRIIPARAGFTDL